jgi:ubiquitin-protein ligase E3 A
MSPHNKAEMIH